MTANDLIRKAIQLVDHLPADLAFRVGEAEDGGRERFPEEIRELLWQAVVELEKTGRK